MPSQNTVVEMLKQIVRKTPVLSTYTSNTPGENKTEFENSLTDLSNDETHCVYVHDESHGWVFVRGGFQTRCDAKQFATLIVEFDAFGDTVNGFDVVVSPETPNDDTPQYEDVYSELQPELKAGIRKALTEYIGQQ
jgi:hypothetical protein